MKTVKEAIQDILQKQINEQFGQEVSIVLELPKDQQFGDYTTNVAMAIFSNSKFKIQNSKIQVKNQKYNTPLELANEIAIILNSQLSTLNFLDKVEAIAPGFINFYLSKEYLIDQLGIILEKDLALQGSTLQGRKVVVEYTDPNPFKEFHIGHLFSNVIGESLSRIFEASGAKVCRVDYYGDVGMHIAKSLYGILQKLKTQNSKLKIKDALIELEKKPLKERIKFLGEGYALGSNVYAENDAAKEEIKHLNKLIYLAAQKMWQEEKGLTPQVDYRQGQAINESELNEVYMLYKTGRKWSLENFEKIYARLGTKFDAYYPESIAAEKGYKLVSDNIINGVFKKSEGAIIFPGEEHGLTHNRVFINSLGLPTYEAKELGLAPWKYENFPYDLSFIVTGTEIQAYFTILLAALKKVNPELGAKTNPVLHGMLRLPEGKMSSRSGNVITGESLLNDTKEQISKSYPEMEEETAEMVTVAAVKYALLKGSIGRDIVFDIATSISLEGNSGPYIQYTYTRTRSVLSKLKTQNLELKTKAQNVKLDARRYALNAEEVLLLRKLYKFSEVLETAAKELSPHLICTYLFDLAHTFNLFYQKHKILSDVILEGAKRPIGSDSITSLRSFQNDSIMDFRLALTQAVGIVLKNGLYVLGIKAPEKM